MACYQPRMAWQLKTPNEFGKTPLHFENPKSDKFKSIMVPCGACFGCQLDKSKQWAIRITHEAKMHNVNCFITLTYEKNPYSLNKEDFQLFMKRLRKRIKMKVRYFHSAEYGEDLSRPHHHAAIFGYDFPDRILRGQRGEYRVYDSQILRETWGHGRVEIGQLTIKSAQYVASYLTKIKKSKKWYKGRMPEHSSMSRMPGLGRAWYDKYKSDVYPHDILYITPKWRSKPPKYYDYLYQKTNESDYKRIKQTRARALLRVPVTELSQERQIQKKACKIAKLMLNLKK